MKATYLVLAAAALCASSAFAEQTPQQPQEKLFTGDTKLACEAILCLSSGERPDACSPSLQRYFSIHRMNKYDQPTPVKRHNFLRQCPTASHDSNMASLVQAIAYGAGNCDAATLNATLTTWRHRAVNDTGPYTIISNKYPPHCTAYTQHGYTDLKAARYIGTQERGGFWADPADYEAKKEAYDRRIAEEDKAKQEAAAKKWRQPWDRAR